MEGLFNLPEILISLVAGAVCDLLFADPGKRKWSFVSAATILSAVDAGLTWTALETSEPSQRLA
jgi:hypothetical protein